MNIQNKKKLKIDDLLSAVGTEGKYQNVIIGISCFLILQNAMILLSSNYNFAISPYTQCPSPHQGISLCTQYACSLPPNQRAQYMNPQIAQIRTLGNQFGNYHCQRQYQISVAMGLLWVGSLIGAIAFSMIADNFGRRKALLLSQFLAMLGIAIIFLAPTLLVAQIGLLIEGAARTASTALAFNFLKEVLSNQTRQKSQIMVQLFYSIGYLFLILLYYLLKDWRPIFLWASFLPQAVCLIFSYFYCQQTPQFLVKMASPQQIKDALYFMASQNGIGHEFLEKDQFSIYRIQQLKERCRQELAEQRVFSFLTLFEFDSLRLKTIGCMILWFGISFLYFMPFLMISQFGFNFFINGVIFSVSEIFTYIIGYCIVTHCKRKNMFYVVVSVIVLASFVLIFISTNKICTSNCWNFTQIFQFILFVIVNFCGAFAFEILIIYVYELFPVQVAALGMGVSQCAMCICNILTPSLLLMLNILNISVMAVFCFVGVMVLLTLFFMPETFNTPSRKIIEELQTDQFCEYS